MAKPAVQKKYERKFNRLIKESDNLSKSAIKRTQGILKDAGKQINSELLAVKADRITIDGVEKLVWPEYRLKELKRAVETQIEVFDKQLSAHLSGTQQAGWQMGQRLVDGPLTAAGISAPVTALSTTTLSILQGYSADLVSGLSQDALRKVNSQILQGVMGQKTPFEIMQNLSTDVFGIDKGIAARAETITRTELARIRNAATQARQEQAVKSGVKLKKRWRGCKSRPGHLAAEWQVQDVEKPFIVNGVELMYPGDPGGPPEETINCGGYSEPFMENWEDLTGPGKV